MKTESIIRLLAGSLVLASLLLAALINPWWLGLAAFVGLNLIQSVFTGFCPAEMVLNWLRARKGASRPADPRSDPGI